MNFLFLLPLVSPRARARDAIAVPDDMGPSSRTKSMGRHQKHQGDLSGAACGQLVDAVPAQLEAVDEGNLYTRAREKNGRNLSSTTSRACTGPTVASSWQEQRKHGASYPCQEVG